MEISKLIRKTIALCVTAALSSGVTFWYYSSKYDDEISEKDAQIAKLQESEQNAKVIQRVSEQMEDIAYQSKSIADTARQKAVIESKKAKEQAERAEQERHKAILAKNKADREEANALMQKNEAERAQEMAQQARDTAILEKAHADSLRYRSIGRSLAQNSMTQYNAGKYDLAKLLAFSGYTFTMQYGGNPYQQEFFTSLLYNASNARSKITRLTGNVKKVECVMRKKTVETGKVLDFVALTDYGEMALMSPDSASNDRMSSFIVKKIFADEKYLFMDMCINDSLAYALNVDGELAVLNIYGGIKQKFTSFSVASDARNPERWFRLLKKKNGNLIAVGEHQVCWIDVNTNKVTRQRYVDETISEAGIGDGRLIVFTKSGKYYVYQEGEPMSWTMAMPKQCVVTAYSYNKDRKLHVIGTDNGNIYLFDDNGLLRAELTGHTGPITHMAYYDWRFVSSSYDKTIRIWNLNDIGELMVPVELKCTSWPLSFDIDRNVKTLRLGYANGEIESLRFSVTDNAANVHDNLDREFSDEEWKHYIGREVPYRRFKEW